MASAAGAHRWNARPRLESLAEWTLALILCVCAFYYLYRYPFAINDASQSPTYTDTPQWLQAGKYVLLAPLVALLFAAAWQSRRIRLSTRDLILTAFVASAGVRAVAAVVFDGGTATLDVLAPILVAAVLVVVLGATLGGSPAAARIGRFSLAFAAVVLVLHAVANVVQIVLWLSIEWLPALGYEDSLLVRFGGLWDDPNSTATYSAVCIVFLVAKRVAVPRNVALVLGGCALFNLVVALSFSAWIVLLVGLLALGAFRVAERRGAVGYARDVVPLLVAVGIAVVAMAGAAVAWPHIVDLPLLTETLAQKEESLRLRLQAETYFDTPASLLGWPFGSNAPGHVENAFGSVLASTGLVGLSLFLAWLVLTVAVVRGTPEFRWLASATTAVAFSSLFVPHLVVFPLATVFLLAIGLTASEYDRPASPVPRAAPDDRNRRRLRTTVKSGPPAADRQEASRH